MQNAAVPPMPQRPIVPHVAWPILVVLVLEFLVWPILKRFLPDVPRCPLCKSSFQWSEIDPYDNHGQKRLRLPSFPCPRCQQTIGEPGWRGPVLFVFYLALIAIFLDLIFTLPGDMFLGFLATLAAAMGAVRVADWFVRRRLEPGNPNPFSPFTER
jgi:hypothetical protein